jgi:hypothetical protein
MTHPSLIVHPATGEILGDLQTAPLEILADTYLHLQDRERQAKQWRQLLAVELEARLAIRQRTVMAVGDYEIRHEAANESVWDADELEVVLQRLADDGAITAAEAAGVIRRPEPIVDRAQAKRLQARLTGPARAAVEACCTWQRKPRAALTVTRSLPLIPESETE